MIDDVVLEIEQNNRTSPINYRKWCVLLGLICWLFFPVLILVTLVCGDRCLADTYANHVMMTVFVGIFGLVTCILSTVYIFHEFHPHFNQPHEVEAGE